MTASAGEVFNAAGWLLGRNAAATPDRVAVTAIDLDGSATDVSYGELDDLAWRAAAGLVAAGIRAEERILLCMADTPELLAMFLGALYIGAVPVPVSTMATAADLATLAGDSLPADTFSGVRLGISAGESLPADLYQRFTGAFGIEVLDGIGSTEALHIFLSNRPGRVRPGSTGEVVPGYQLRIENADGEQVPDGEPGSLYVQGDSVATGYWCRSEVSRRVFRGEWLRTGDIYVRDADGYYTCLGRIDDVMKAGGQWVSPGEVEARLRAHPGVEQAVVVAVPDGDGLDKPVACVVAKAGAAPAEAELIAFCRAGLASYKRPRHVLFLPGFPLTAIGKVQRFRLREHAVAELAGRGARPAAAPPARQSEPA